MHATYFAQYLAAATAAGDTHLVASALRLGTANESNKDRTQFRVWSEMRQRGTV